MVFGIILVFSVFLLVVVGGGCLLFPSLDPCVAVS